MQLFLPAKLLIPDQSGSSLAAAVAAAVAVASAAHKDDEDEEDQLMPFLCQKDYVVPVSGNRRFWNMKPKMRGEIRVIRGWGSNLTDEQEFFALNFLCSFKDSWSGKALGVIYVHLLSEAKTKQN